ncbi:hypothetical protein V8G54_015845 [Vigna mungo]|uniref:Argonaute linker 1 domain-containing protein n=1 Tax=Vigna mungo TaxID=3915 RepID=A0AAQ3NK48_VIGMU
METLIVPRTTDTPLETQYITSRTTTSSTQYIHNTFAISVPSVTLPDRKPVVQYLQGTLTSTDSIEDCPEDPSFAPKSTIPSSTASSSPPPSGFRVFGRHGRVLGVCSLKLKSLLFPYFGFLTDEAFVSLRPTQMGLSLNIDVSSRAFYEAIPVLGFVSKNFRLDLRRPLPDQDRIKRYTKRLNEDQMTALLRATCQRPRDREDSTRQIVRQSKFITDKFARHFEIQVEPYILENSSWKILYVFQFCYDFTIQYKPGKENIPTDPLSRSCLMAWSESNFKWLEQIAQMTIADAELNKLLLQHTQCILPAHKFVVKDGIVFKRGRLMIPADMRLRNQILQEFHDSKVGGHAGTTKTIARICKQFYWPKMQEDIKQYIRKGRKRWGYISRKKDAPENKKSDEYEAWEDENYLVKSWLLDSMTKEIRSLFICLATAKDIWDAVQQTYSVK